MITIFLFIGLQTGQIEQELQRQQSQLQQMQEQLEQQERHLERIVDVLAQQHKAQRSVCSAEIRWVNDEQRTAPYNGAVPLSAFSTVSTPSEACLPAEIRLTAAYLDSVGNLICSGVVQNVANQTALTQTINLEVRPWNFREFVRWKNEPPQINSGAARLVCLNVEGLLEATDTELAKVVTVLVRASTLPRGGGLSTAEVRLNRPR